MFGSRQVAARVTELVEARRPFVLATVVRAQCPTSTRPGDAAVVLPDGTIEGFVGGQCAEESVRTAAADVLASNEELLLRILPDDAEIFPDAPGARTTVNPCLSGGAIEVYLEPKLPAPSLAVIGSTPIAAALADLGQRLGFAVTVGPESTGSPERATAVIVASHGRQEPEAVRAALDAGVGYIGLVASKIRGASVIDTMELDDDERLRVRSPVGLDIGARTAEEIALSILADVVRAIRRGSLLPPAASLMSRPETVIDPVCGMTVMIVADTPHLRRDGVDHWFCNPRCRTRFAQDADG